MVIGLPRSYQVCAWFGLGRLPNEIAREFFSGSFFERNGFIFLLPASRTCSMPRQGFFCTLYFAQSRKVVS